MSPLYLLRHGPTAASGRAPLGRLDLPVLPAGEAQWPALRAELLNLGLRQVFTSPLQRARRHAEDLGLPCTVLESLSEQAWGSWEGVPWDELRDTEAFFGDPIHQAPPGGESFAACAARATATLAELPVAGPSLILAHAGVLRALLAHLLAMPLARALDLAWEPFGLTRVDPVAPDRGVLRWHNLRPPFQAETPSPR